MLCVRAQPNKRIKPPPCEPRRRFFVENTGELARSGKKESLHWDFPEKVVILSPLDSGRKKEYAKAELEQLFYISGS